MLMCVDCILASPRIGQADPGRRIPPRCGSVTLLLDTCGAATSLELPPSPVAPCDNRATRYAHAMMN
jgi:hypothetical protein